MQKLYEYYKTHCPSVDSFVGYEEQWANIAEQGTHLFFNAFSSLAFIVWIRYVFISELDAPWY